MKSVGFHLVGLPEVRIPYSSKTTNGRAVADSIDLIADEMAARGVEATIKAYGATLSYDSPYEEDDFMFNPYGKLLLPEG